MLALGNLYSKAEIIVDVIHLDNIQRIATFEISKIETCSQRRRSTEDCQDGRHARQLALSLADHRNHQSQKWWQRCSFVFCFPSRKSNQLITSSKKTRRLFNPVRTHHVVLGGSGENCRFQANDILSLGIGDISVGRRHVAITMEKPTMQSVRVQGEHTKLFIRDLSSKYGVFVNGKRIEPAKDIEVTIQENQTWAKQDKRHVAGRGYGGLVTVVIGDKTSFRLERVDWSLCSQGLTALAKVGIVSTAAEIDCKVEDAWAPGVSTHLVVGKSKRSEKLSLALAEGGHLVNVAWLKAVETSFKESWDSKGQKDARTLETDFPAPVPDAFEISNVQWRPDALRRNLFSDYCFISVANVKV
ncbi:hypothetical protein BGX20_008231 [Mortierella sp. AD010]|nr:hypothetical protein BGX20_008231 [Mortierella sp. AD010]